MSNLKLVGYEVKRLIFTKFYAALLLVTVAFSYYILSTKTIFGTAYTAPFSRWSFAAYLFDVLPFMLLAALFFCTYTFSRNERRVCAITLSTPLTMKKYYALKAAAIALGYLITALLVLAAGFLFCGLVFHYYDWSAFLSPALLILAPPFLFFCGAGMLLGRVNANLLYALLLLAFAEGLVGFSVFGQWGLLDKSIVTSYPLSLMAQSEGADLPFTLPAAWALARWGWGALGAGLFTCLLFAKNKKERQK